jgi:hypothetical protein
MNKHGNPKHGGHGTHNLCALEIHDAALLHRHGDQLPLLRRKGITVCARWHEFAAFLADMDECPDRTMTLDRHKNEIGYEPGNCRWTTQAEQNKHRSSCVELTHNGITQNVADWAAAVGMTANTIRMRLRLGWTVERALTQPLTKTYRIKGMS